MVKQRENSRVIKERKDKEGNLLCLVPICDNLREKYKKGNRFRNYCKNHGFEDMRPFTSWSALRLKCFKKDNYTCIECGFKSNSIHYKDGRELIADHIKSIALGGDEWDINNLQTLCMKCNKIKTKKDQKKIAQLRTIEKKQKGNTKLNLSKENQELLKEIVIERIKRLPSNLRLSIG